MALHPNDILWAPDEPSVADRDRVLSIRWLGTAGYELCFQGTVVLIDPYFSRIPLSQIFFRAQINHEAIDRGVERADAVLVGHSHFDHVLDVPTICKKTGAPVYGSQSTANLCAAAGLPAEQIHVLDNKGAEFEVGPFHITAVTSEHSPFMMGRIPFPGDVPCTCDLPMAGRHYRCGQVFNYLIRVGSRQIYHLGSAQLVDDALKTADIDMALICAAGRNHTERYVERVIRQVEPQRIIPMHYDNFFRTLDSDMKMLPRMHLDRLVDEIHAVDNNVAVHTLGINKRISILV